MKNVTEMTDMKKNLNKAKVLYVNQYQSYNINNEL